MSEITSWVVGTEQNEDDTAIMESPAPSIA